MAEQIIDVGTAPNNGTGDPLRTAFIKTDNNFDQIWAAGPVGSNVRIQNNVVSTLQVNQDLALSPNGVGNVRLNNNTIPGANNTWFLGSTTNQWRGVYANSITAGNVTINNNLVVPGDVTIEGNLTVEGDTIQIGNIVTDTKTIQLSNTASTANAATGSGITVGANDNIATLLYNSASNVWATNIGITATGNVTAPYFIGNGALLTGIISYSNANATSLLASFGSNTISTTGNITAGYFIGNGSQLTGITSYANANAVAYGEAGWAGNIIPSGNAVYSLGNATNQWNDLYVSNATIFMNNVPISLSAGNVLTVNGNAVLQNNSNSTISTTGNITAGNIGITGGSLTWANASIVQTSASDVSITGDGQVTVRSLSGTYQWTFDSNGNLILPGSIISASTIELDNRAYGNSADINLYAADDITLQARDRTLGSTSEGGDINIFAGDSAEDSDSSGGDVQIRAGDGGAANVDFGGSGGFITIQSGQGGAAIGNSGYSAESGGALTLNAGDAGSNNGNIDLGADGGNVYIGAGDSTGNGVNGGTIYLTSGAADASALAGDVVIQAGGTWTFDGAGNLSAPGNVSAVGNITADYFIGDGSQLTGISTANTGNVTFSDQVVMGTGSTDGDGGLYLAPGNNSIANSAVQYLRVRGGDVVTHIHLDTGNNQYYDQYFGADSRYVKLEANGNVVINADDYNGNAGTWTFDTNGNLNLPGNLVIAGNANVFGTNASLLQPTDNLPLLALSSGANGAVSSLWVEDIGNVGTSNIAAVYANPTPGSKIVRIAVGQNGSPGPNLWDFDSAGNLTVPGNIIMTTGIVGSGASPAPSLSGFSSVSAITVSASGNVTGGNIIATGGGTIRTDGNVNGNVFNGNVAFGSGVIGGSGNITGGNILGNGASMTGVATQVTGSWTVTTGTNNYSFTVPINNTYQLWVLGNIPNGIIVYNATVSVSNTNVPVIGQQFAWNYEGAGNPILLTSIPAQVIGTAGAISNAQPAVATTNVFTFGINNTSGNTVTVNYGYTKIS